MRRPYIATMLSLIALGSTPLQCSAGEVQGQPSHAFDIPYQAATRITPEESLMRAINTGNLSDDAKHISVSYINGSTVLTGYVKDDRERQLISNLAQQANCPDIVNKLEVKSSTATPQQIAQAHKGKLIVIKNGKQIVF